MTKYVKLTAQQKDEIRRLTQLANRRIRNAEKAYNKAGKDIIPNEIAGPYQDKRKWATESTPISRTVKFESKKDYNEQMRILRSFDPKATRAHRPGIKEYTEIQREKTALAISTSLDGGFSYSNMMGRLANLTAPQLSDFWNTFSEKASHLGMNYSSEAAMEETFAELFPEDLVSTIPERV